jgi:thiol-disulfide isomerase/thioredoxin
MRVLEMTLRRSQLGCIYNSIIFGALAAVILLTLICWSDAFAQNGKKWNLVSHLSIEIDGEVDKEARFYLSDDRLLLMILSSEFKDTLVVSVKERIVHALKGERLKYEDEEFVAWTSQNAQLQFLANYTQTKSHVNVNLAGKEVRIIAREHLVGQATLGEIQAHTPTYRRLAGIYEPNPEAVEFLSRYTEPVNILIVFGTWCPHCKDWVPKFMKSISNCDNPNLNCSYFGISRKFDQPKKFIQEEKITNLPTVIVQKEGKEIGRIIGTPNVSMEDDLTEILKGTYTGKQSELPGRSK